MSKLIVAFHGSHLLASGDLPEVALKAKAAIEHSKAAPVLLFDDITSEPVEVDFRGSDADVLARLATLEGAEAGAAEPRRPGRPKLGVVAREVTLLPRHWEWLNGQPGGASVALRKLVEQARTVQAPKDRLRLAQESTYRFLSALAGNEPGYEEALRALFAGDRAQFELRSAPWPGGVREHARKLAARAFAAQEATLG